MSSFGPNARSSDTEMYKIVHCFKFHNNHYPDVALIQLLECAKIKIKTKNHTFQIHVRTCIDIQTSLLSDGLISF